MKKKSMFFSMVLLASLCSAPSMVHAQRGNNGNSHGNANGHDAPIDGGLSLLLAAGIGAGAKKAYDKRKAKLQEGAAD
ncbi:hypothetical protein SAMN05444008_111180 [Cnuella takakiae]|uniref:Uncharacterized protein n=1 Tax=Cnuella takakiae TaxID=1302690 RepID=A0A1M5E2G8_9BACT|nr:hypothetical protein [Cnuella takakiae]SHF73458.1 hypothetical protein SAMN05444008_111180 [Cnuella takakiae]